MIENYYNTLVSIRNFAEGTAPAYEPSYTYSDAFYGCLDNQSSRQIYNDQGRAINIDAIFYCDSSVSVDENDKLKKIDLHAIVLGDVGTYHRELIDSPWILTTSAHVGKYVIFYGATTNKGTGAACDGKEYSIARVHDANFLYHHTELYLFRAGGK